MTTQSSGGQTATQTSIETISTPDGAAEAYVARPAGGGSHPGVLFFMDAIGLRPQIMTMIERIASWGYVVAAPNLFFRSGSADELAPRGDLREPGEREAFFAGIGPRLGSLTSESIQADNVAYLAGLLGLEGVADAPVGVTGYCMGARFSTFAAGRHGDEVAACGGFHGGRLVTDAPDSPHLSLAGARAEFVYGHADQDASMPPEAVAALGETLAGHGLVAKNEIYAGAPHGYTMADTSMYDATGAERHYTELEALFARALRG